MSETVREPVTVLENSKQVTRYIEKAIIKTKFVLQTHLMNAVQVTDATGKALAAEKLAASLAKEVPILIAAGSKDVDPQYLQRVKADTAILRLPVMQVPQGEPLAIALPKPPEKALQNEPTPSSGGWTLVMAQEVVIPNSASPKVEPAPASGPPPRFVRIQALEDKLVLSEPVTVVGHGPAAPGAAGAEVSLIEPAMGDFAHWNSRVIAAENFLVFEVDGRPVNAAAFKQRARTPIIALFSDLGKKVDPVWLSIYKPGTLIVYVRPEAMRGGHYGGGYMPMMAPPAAAPPAP
jgi:hypothetical protein